MGTSQSQSDIKEESHTDVEYKDSHEHASYYNMDDSQTGNDTIRQDGVSNTKMQNVKKQKTTTSKSGYQTGTDLENNDVEILYSRQGQLTESKTGRENENKMDEDLDEIKCTNQTKMSKKQKRKSKWKSMPDLAIGQMSYSQSQQNKDIDNYDSAGTPWQSNSTQMKGYANRKQSNIYRKRVRSQSSLNKVQDNLDGDDEDLEYQSVSEDESTDEESEQMHKFDDPEGYQLEFQPPTSEVTRYKETQNFYDNVDEERYLRLEHDILKNGIPLAESVKTKQVKKKGREQYYMPFLSNVEMRNMILHNPLRYKRCIIHIEGAHSATCTNIDTTDPISFIEISGRSKCGRVFNGDEVLIEILNLDQVKEVNIPRFNIDINRHNKTTVYGKVVGCFKTSRPMDHPILGLDPPTDMEDLNNPVFVCTLDESCTYLMKPVCKTVPKIHVLHDPKRPFLIKIFKYCDKTRNFELDRHIKIDQGDYTEYIFVTVYINWTSNYPLGMVIDAIRTQDNFDTGMRILRMTHQVPFFYQRDTMHQVKQILSEKSKCDEALSSDRKDLCQNLNVFTIDPAGSKDLDDALSIEFYDNETFRVGVHIADVTSLIQKDDAIDKEAQERATTFYPGQGINPYHMFPEPIATDLCSLKPGERRRAISLFYIMTKDAKIMHSDIQETWIMSAKQYTYEEVQIIIKSNEMNDNFKKEIHKLFSLATCMRKNRLGPAMNSLPVETGITGSSNSAANSIEAHYLVEEFMVLSNFYVGKVLMGKYPKCVPLRCQNAPSKENVEKWRKDNIYISDFIIKLQGVEPCKGDQINIKNIPENVRYSHALILQKCIWNTVVQDSEKSDFQSLQKLLGTDELHPDIALAYEQWIDFQEQACYRCSGDASEIESKHFSLNIWPYVHFTSPIRRYSDIVVHRILHAHLDKKTCPYSQEEVSDLCNHINEVTKRAKKYQKECETMSWGKSLQQSPVLINGYVKSTTDSALSISFPGMRRMPARYREIPFKLLQLSKRPDDVTDYQLTLEWSRRIYHRRGKYIFQERKQEKAIECQKLDPYQRCKFVLVKTWKNLHDHILKKDRNALQYTVLTAPRTLNLTSKHRSEPGRISDVTSEFPDGNILKQTCDFSMTFCIGQVLSIQISAELEKGVLVPSPQLFNMTRNSKYCLQHTRDPVKFLAKYSTQDTYCNNYSSAMDYITKWKPLMDMEFASSAVRDHTATVNAVPVTFLSPQIGRFSLGVWYCDERDIEFPFLSRKFIVEGERSDEEIKYCSDYLCIRCEIPKEMSPGTYMKSDTPSNQGFIWLAHAQIQNVTRIEVERKPSPNKVEAEMSKAVKNDSSAQVIKKWQVDFKIHSNSLPPTPDMLSADGGVRCCVELIQKSETDRRIEAVINCLNEATPLAKSIALRHRIPQLDKEHFNAGADIDIDSDMGNMQPSNKSQKRAIKKALTQSFSLIHGPPGTGKTYTAMKLVHLFWKINQKIYEGNKQIVFCGPSNKSVDLVAKWAKQKIPELKNNMVRLYGTSIEHCDYPIPAKHIAKTSSTKKSVPDPALADVSVHNLIRQNGKSAAEKIKKYDSKFKRYLEIMNEREKRRKEREESRRKNILKGREMSNELNEHLENYYKTVVGNVDDEETKLKESKEEIFNALSIRHATLLYDAEDSNINTKCEIFKSIVTKQLETLIKVLHQEQNDYHGDSILPEIKAFKKDINEAVQNELKMHDIIFCTTAVATSARFLKATKGRIYQLIIDECGMCTEPETMSAIIATRANQIVLIGDHLQLRPIVICKEAEKLGLEISLFERYKEKATMLRYQYRMHPEICQFPSEKFYNNELVTEESPMWKTDTPLGMWRNHKIPIAFGHVEGIEEKLTVSTEEGNERSSSNKQEVEKVMEVFLHMVRNEGVNPSDINIMSQYNAQCHAFREALKKENIIGFNVNTVVASQGGEWDYVIMSTVRSLPQYRIEKHPTMGWCIENLGFITDDHQVNVALTRARKGLVIIGNKNLLECDYVWRALIKHYGTRGCFYDLANESLIKKTPKMNPRKSRRRQESVASEEDFYKGTDMEDFVLANTLQAGRIVDAVDSEQKKSIDEPPATEILYRRQ